MKKKTNCELSEDVNVLADILLEEINYRKRRVDTIMFEDMEIYHKTRFLRDISYLEQFRKTLISISQIVINSIEDDSKTDSTLVNPFDERYKNK